MATNNITSVFGDRITLPTKFSGDANQKHLNTCAISQMAGYLSAEKSRDFKNTPPRFRIGYSVTEAMYDTFDLNRGKFLCILDFVNMYRKLQLIQDNESSITRVEYMEAAFKCLVKVKRDDKHRQLNLKVFDKMDKENIRHREVSGVDFYRI